MPFVGCTNGPAGASFVLDGEETAMSMPSLKNYAAALFAVFLMGQSVAAHAQLPDFTPLVEAASPAVVNLSLIHI